MTGTITKLDGTMKPIPGFSMCRRGETVTLGGCARGARYDTTTEYFKDEFVYVPFTKFKGNIILEAMTKKRVPTFFSC